jgi:hypothetical protein
MAPRAVAVVVALLAYAGIVGEVGADGRRDADDEPGLQLWEFHDLLFHAQAREGIHGGPSGGTYRFRSPIPTTPRVAPVRTMSTRVVGPCHGAYRRNRAKVCGCSADVIDTPGTLPIPVGGYHSSHI